MKKYILPLVLAACVLGLCAAPAAMVIKRYLNIESTKGTSTHAVSDIDEIVIDGGKVVVSLKGDQTEELTVDDIMNMYYSADTTYNEDNMVLRVRPLADDSKYVFPAYSWTDSLVIDWGDGNTDFLEGASTRNTRFPAHEYADAGREYIVQVHGGLTGFTTSMSYYPNAHVNDVKQIIQWGRFLKITTFDLQMDTCVTYIPAPPKETLAVITSANNMFYKCKNIKKFDKDFFANAPKLSTMQNSFQGCESIEEFPEDFFNNLPSLSNMLGAFRDCKKLRKAPDFSKTKLSNISQLFAGCESLTEVPEGIFPSTLCSSSSMNLNMTFSGCKSLEALPEHLFDGMNANRVTSMNSMFEGCEKLKSVNLDFIDKQRGCYQFRSTFSGCAQLTTYPVSHITNDLGVEVDVPLWERAAENNKSQFAGGRNVSGNDCFAGCVAMKGYNDEIPTAWGGLYDGTNAFPTLSLSYTLPEGADYYSVDFLLKGTDVISSRYYLSSKQAVTEYLAANPGKTIADIVSEQGNDIESNYIEAVNSNEGLHLAWDDAVPDYEYILIASATNRFGTAVEQLVAKTNPTPKGSDAYESYVGKWTVTTASSASTYEEYEQVPITYDVEILPYRVNESYMVYGFGATKFAQVLPWMMKFDAESGSISINTGAANGSLLYSGYTWQDETTQATKQGNAVYYPYAMIDGYFSIYALTAEKAFEGKSQAGTGSFTMSAVKSEALTKFMGDGNDYYPAGIDVFLVYGDQSGAYFFQPLEIVLEKYQLPLSTKYRAQLGMAPYTFAPAAQGTPSAKEAFERSMGSRGIKGFEMSRINGKATATEAAQAPSGVAKLN